LDNLSDREIINRALEDIKRNIETSAKESLGLHELKQHKPWFDEDPNRSKVDDLINVRLEASRHVRCKNKENLNAEIDELET